MLTTPAVPPAAAAALHIDFRAAGEGHEYLIAGWSYAEPDYTWTLGTRSILHLPTDGIATDCALKFRCGPMVRPGLLPFQRVIVEANGLIIARLVCRALMQTELLVPREALQNRRTLELILHLPDSQSPKDLGGSADTRDLGIWLSSLDFAPLPEPQRTAPPAQAADKSMLMQLQSLGENCELGFVQRAAGAEPLGLFRWAAAPLPKLLAALDARFAGLGSPGSLLIEADAATEFQITDTRYGFRSHSFAFENKGARRDDILRRELVRLPYLSRMLIEDLEAAEKLFCFHDAGQSGPEKIAALVRALGRYGPNWLLWVCKANTPAQIGTAELAGERLIRGYVDAFQPLNNVRSPSTNSWMGAIRAAHAIWRQQTRTNRVA